jgi:hypothetical protein
MLPIQRGSLLNVITILFGLTKTLIRLLSLLLLTLAAFVLIYVYAAVGIIRFTVVISTRR